MGRLEGKAALVTGASGGIGQEICRRLTEEGAWVAVADVDEDKGVRLARDLGKAAHFIKLDVTQEDQWRAAIATVTSQFGGLDILVNNAGILKPASIEDATLADWRDTMSVNGEGVFLGCKFAVEAMKERDAAQGWATIINMASTMAVRGMPGHAVYSATKAAVRALTKSVALHCGKRGYRIRVNCILPGAIVTDMLRQNIGAQENEAAYFEGLLARYPLRRLGTPLDIANAVAFLASEEAAFMTGTDLMVDGGSTV